VRQDERDPERGKRFYEAAKKGSHFTKSCSTQKEKVLAEQEGKKARMRHGKEKQRSSLKEGRLLEVRLKERLALSRVHKKSGFCSRADLQGGVRAKAGNQREREGGGGTQRGKD